MPSRNPESNLAGLDYRRLASDLGTPVAPIIDVHSHINGQHAPIPYRDARQAFGVSFTYSMTAIDSVAPVRAALGDSVRFIAMPRFYAPDRLHAFTQGFIDDLALWHAEGCRMCKFWTAPRAREIARSLGDPAMMDLESPWRRRQMDRAAELGMMFMAHIADPDTWFATKYADAAFYGTKASHYEPVERLAEIYTVPWILAHMGGWPEDLSFLSGLLDRHANIHLDTSATKWMVRELGKHPRDELLRFITRYKNRLLFGSDIVTLDDHLSDAKTSTFAGGEKGRQASSYDEAFDLYASRYYALRTLWETDHNGPAPFADGDLKMVDPEHYTERSAATLIGQRLPPDLLRALYHDNAAKLVHKWFETH